MIYSFRTGHEQQNHGTIPPDPQRFDAEAVVSKFNARTDTIEFTGTIDVFDQKSVNDVNSIEVGNNRSIIHESQRIEKDFLYEHRPCPKLSLHMLIIIIWFIGSGSSQETINLQDRS